MTKFITRSENQAFLELSRQHQEGALGFEKEVIMRARYSAMIMEAMMSGDLSAIPVIKTL